MHQDYRGRKLWPSIILVVVRLVVVTFIFFTWFSNFVSDRTNVFFSGGAKGGFAKGGVCAPRVFPNTNNGHELGRQATEPGHLLPEVYYVCSS